MGNESSVVFPQDTWEFLPMCQFKWHTVCYILPYVHAQSVKMTLLNLMDKTCFTKFTLPNLPM